MKAIGCLAQTRSSFCMELWDSDGRRRRRSRSWSWSEAALQEPQESLGAEERGEARLLCKYLLRPGLA